MVLFQGVIFGLLAAITFGFIPLFTLPLLNEGYSVPCILFYRFSIATLAMAAVLRFMRYPLLAGKSDSIRLLALGFLYIISGIPFFTALTFLDSGIVATIQFSYPVMVVVLMFCFFNEKLKITTTTAVLMAFCGVALLSFNPELNGAPLNMTGVWLTLLSALLTALYVTGIQVVPLKSCSGLGITMYPLMCGTVYSFIYALLDQTLVLPHRWQDWACLTLQATVTCVVSNVALVASVKRIGSTLAAVLGAVEPLVAVSIGIFVFDEQFSWRNGVGVSLIVGAVLVVMLVPYLKQHLPGREQTPPAHEDGP